MGVDRDLSRVMDNLHLNTDLPISPGLDTSLLDTTKTCTAVTSTPHKTPTCRPPSIAFPSAPAWFSLTQAECLPGVTVCRRAGQRVGDHHLLLEDGSGSVQGQEDPDRPPLVWSPRHREDTGCTSATSPARGEGGLHCWARALL